ncbi:hypothetical protein NDU88_004748 [Pleurodeles waltl]|uniref:Uncharacterized protein n=1 Tax=Pleurodeles waltl TaxID=8319 RepID=A0AAV7RLD5_PLEWA|nr:hypothetical protein NDU88_004748 [Pleurodeles waltl]
MAPEVIMDFLDQVDVPKVTGEQHALLKENLLEDTFWEALWQLPRGKVPGPDSFLEEWYQQYRAQLFPRLLETLQEEQQSEILPISMCVVMIIMIPNLEKDPADPPHIVGGWRHCLIHVNAVKCVL